MKASMNEQLQSAAKDLGIKTEGDQVAERQEEMANTLDQELKALASATLAEHKAISRVRELEKQAIDLQHQKLLLAKLKERKEMVAKYGTKEKMEKHLLNINASMREMKTRITFFETVTFENHVIEGYQLNRSAKSPKHLTVKAYFELKGAFEHAIAVAVEKVHTDCDEMRRECEIAGAIETQKMENAAWAASRPNSK